MTDNSMLKRAYEIRDVITILKREKSAIEKKIKKFEVEYNNIIDEAVSSDTWVEYEDDYVFQIIEKYKNDGTRTVNKELFMRDYPESFTLIAKIGVGDAEDIIPRERWDEYIVDPPKKSVYEITRATEDEFNAECDDLERLTI